MEDNGAGVGADLEEKEDTTYSTLCTEGLILSYMIDMADGRDVETADIPGNFIHNYYDRGDIHIKWRGKW